VLLIPSIIAVTCSGSGITTNSTPVAVSAPASAISTLPWTENFDAMSTLGAGITPSCWTNVTGTKAWTSMNTASVTYNAPKSTPNYMTIYMVIRQRASFGHLLFN
jgi:hypothetical protein